MMMIMMKINEAFIKIEKTLLALELIEGVDLFQTGAKISMAHVP